MVFELDLVNFALCYHNKIRQATCLAYMGQRAALQVKLSACNCKFSGSNPVAGRCRD